ncbi:MAG: TlpA family protein disulfide reductase [Desulfobulbus sp.]|jgi:thiol-disulfide isomerase/thioredoxin
MNKRHLFFWLIFFLLLPCAVLAMNRVEVGGPLIPFKGSGLDGESIDLAASIGNKPVMLVFWASWCSACKSEMPKINKLVDLYGERGMEFVSINVGHNDSVRRARAFARKTGMQYPTLFDERGVVSEQYQLRGVPTIIIADKRGVIQFQNHWVPEIPEQIFERLSAD